MEFLSSPEVNIPVSGINIGPVHKKDVLRANVMNEKVGAKERGGGSRVATLCEPFVNLLAHTQYFHQRQIVCVK